MDYSRVFEGQAYAGYAPPPPPKQCRCPSCLPPPPKQCRCPSCLPPPKPQGCRCSSYLQPPRQCRCPSCLPLQRGLRYSPQRVVQPQKVNNFRAGLRQGFHPGWELFGDDITSGVGESIAGYGSSGGGDYGSGGGGDYGSGGDYGL